MSKVKIRNKAPETRKLSVIKKMTPWYCQAALGHRIMWPALCILHQLAEHPSQLQLGCPPMKGIYRDCKECLLSEGASQ